MNLLDKDYFADLMGPQRIPKENLNPAQQQAQLQELKLKEDFYKQKSNDAANKYFDSIPEGVEISKVPPQYKPAVTQFSNQAIQDTYKLKMLIKQSPAGSPINLRYRQELSQVQNRVSNLNNQFENFKQYKEDYLVAETNGQMSKANSGNKLNLLSDVYTDKMKMQISSDGDIFFVNEEGYAKFNELDDYIVKDNNAAQEILKMNESAYKAGRPLDKHTENLYRIKLQKLVGKINTAKSLATDDFVVPGGLGVDPRLLHDPNRSQELRDFVVKSYLDSFKNTASQSASRSSSSNSVPGGSASARKYQSRMNNVLNGWDMLGKGDASYLNSILSGNDEIIPSEEEPGIFEYYSGNKVALIDPNNPQDLYHLLSGQNIPDNLWPKLNAQSQQTPEQLTAQDYIEKYS